MTPKEIIYGDRGYTGFTPAEQSTWQALLGRWTQALRGFDAAVADLRVQAASPDVRAVPALHAEAQALLARADAMGPRIAAVRAAVDDVRHALRGAFQSISGAWRDAAAWVGLQGDSDDSGLAAVQFLIPAAAVLAAIALIGSFVTDYARFARNVAVYRETIERGGSIEDARRAVAAVQPPGLLALNIGGIPIWLLAVGVAAVFLLRGRTT